MTKEEIINAIQSWEFNQSDLSEIINEWFGKIRNLSWSMSSQTNVQPIEQLEQS